MSVGIDQGWRAEGATTVQRPPLQRPKAAATEPSLMVPFSAPTRRAWAAAAAAAAVRYVGGVAGRRLPKAKWLGRSIEAQGGGKWYYG